jgi:hypothetical protein
MGREVRRVPADWEHPTDEYGDPVPLLDGWALERDLGTYAVARYAWETEVGGAYERRYGGEHFGHMMEDKRLGCSFRDWHGETPDPGDYMPRWSDAERTHYQYYECTTEGTPLSPVFQTLEELGDWLSEHMPGLCGLDFAKNNISGERPWDRR